MNNLNARAFAAAAKGFAILCAALVIVLALYVVYDLFYSFIHVGFVWSALSAFASVGLFVGFVATTATHQNNAVRGVSALYALLFGGVTLVLVALGGALQSPNLFIVPPQLMQMGQVAGALLPAVAAISVVSTWVTHRTPDDKFDSVGSAVGHYLMNLAKLVGVLASMAFGFYFGTSHGVQPFVAIIACGLLESLFVASMNNSGHAHDRRDAFDLFMWGFCAIVIGGFLALMSVESVSSLAKIDVMPEWLRNAGAAIFVSSIGVSIIMFLLTTVLTKMIDIPMVAKAYGVRSRDVLTRAPAEGWQIMAPPQQRAALPAATQYAKESPTGTGYDITAEIRMPDEEITKPLGKVAEQARQEVSQYAPTREDLDRIKQGKSYRGMSDEEAERVARLEWEFDHEPQPPLSPEAQAALDRLTKGLSAGTRVPKATGP